MAVAMILSLLPVNGLTLTVRAEEAMFSEPTTEEPAVSEEGPEFSVESASEDVQIFADDVESPSENNTEMTADDSEDPSEDGTESIAADDVEIVEEEPEAYIQDDFSDGLDLSGETALFTEDEEPSAGASVRTEDSVVSVSVGGGALQYYEDLSQAWTDIQGKTAEMTLLKDMTSLTGALTITDENTDITFSAEEGHKLSGNITTDGIFRVRAGILRFMGGEIENTSSSNAYGILVTNTGQAEISGGKIIGGKSGSGIGVRVDGEKTSITISGNAEIEGYYGVYLNKGPSAEISGGKLTGSYMGLCVNTATAVISGGTFFATGSNYSLYVTGGTARGLLKKGYAYFVNQGLFEPTASAIMVAGVVTVQECSHSWTWQDDCDGLHHTRTCGACGETETGEHDYGAGNICQECGADKNAETVARITMADGTVLNYTNLLKAWNAVQGRTAVIEVLKSVNLGSDYLKMNSEDSEITLKMTDGITVSGSNSSGGVIYVSGGSLTIENGTIEGSMYGVNIASGGSVKIIGSTVNATSATGYGIYVNSFVENTSKVEISGGTINGNAAVNAGPRTGIYVGQNSEAVVYGGAVVRGSETGIHLENGGSAEIRDGEIVGAGSGVGCYGLRVNGGKAVITGGKISGSTGLRMEGDTADVRISGGTVEATGTSGMTISGGKFILSDNGAVIGGTTGLGMSGGTFEMTGGSVTTEKITGNYTGTCVSVSKGTFIMSGGTITAWSEGFNPSYGVGVSGSVHVEISGGTVIATKGYSLYRFVDDVKSSTIELKGGIFRGTTGTVYDGIGTAGGLLGEGCAYREIDVDADENITNGAWVTDEEALNKKGLPDRTAVRVSQIPVSVVLNDTEITYGDTAALAAEVSTADETLPVEYQWYKDEEKLDGEEAEQLTIGGLDVGEYTYHCQVTYDGYTVQSGTARVKVNPKSLTVIASAANKTYNGKTDAQITAVIDRTQLVGTDSIAVTGLTGTFADAKAGTGKTVNVDHSKAVVTGNDKGNYEIVYPATATATINPASLTITGAAVGGKTNDGSTEAAVSGVSFAGVITGESLKAGVDYTVTGRFASAAAGTHKVTVTVKMLNGNYKLEKAQFTVNGTIRSAAIDLNAGLKVSWSGSALKVSWGKVTKADGYEIYAAKCGKSLKRVKTVKKQNTVSAQVGKLYGAKLKTSANYKIQVKAYRMINGKKTYIATSLSVHTAGKANKTYTNVSKVKVSKSALTLKTGKTSKISATVTKQSSKKKLLTKTHAARLRYWSTDTKVATVTSGGKIKAVGKGQCYVYVMAQNGTKARVKVTVK